MNVNKYSMGTVNYYGHQVSSRCFCPVTEADLTSLLTAGLGAPQS